MTGKGKEWTAKELNSFLTDRIEGMSYGRLAQKYQRSKNSVISAWHNNQRRIVYYWEEIKATCKSK